MEVNIEEIQNKIDQVTVKFNAWHKEQKKMYLAEELGQDQMTLMPDGRGFANISGDSTKLSQIDDGKTMIPLQYIGRTDCEGVELYHGDIVEAWTDGLSHRGKLLRGWIDSVSGGFRLEGPISTKGGLDNAYYGPLKKVGTIFENPELLKETDDGV